MGPLNGRPTDHLQLTPEIPQAGGGLRARQLFREKHRHDGI